MYKSSSNFKVKRGRLVFFRGALKECADSADAVAVQLLYTNGNVNRNNVSADKKRKERIHTTASIFNFRFNFEILESIWNRSTFEKCFGKVSWNWNRKIICKRLYCLLFIFRTINYQLPDPTHCGLYPNFTFLFCVTCRTLVLIIDIIDKISIVIESNIDWFKNGILCKLWNLLCKYWAHWFILVFLFSFRFLWGSLRFLVLSPNLFF